MTSALRHALALTLAAFLSSSGFVVAGDLHSSDNTPTSSVVLPKSGEVKEISAYPAKISLESGDDADQLVISAALTSGRLQDLSGDVQYSVANENVAHVTKAGRV